MMPELKLPNRAMYVTWEAWADAVLAATQEFNIQLRAYLESLAP